MTDASLALQKAVFATLTTALAPTRVFDNVPQDSAFPLIQIADGQTIADDAECIEGVEVFLDIHVWSREVGMVECRSLAGRVRKALHHAPLALEQWRLVDLMHRDTRFLNDPDGVTAHAVVTVRALIDPV